MIEIDNNETGVLKALTEICINLQRKYDISPELINEIINDESLKSIATDVNRDLYTEMMHKISNTDILNTENNWSSECCGYVLEEFPNGYLKFCNDHKYIHNNTTGHEFTPKTSEQISTEMEFESKYLTYQNYINELFRILMEYVINKIKGDYRVLRIRADEISKINDILKSNYSCFKSRDTIQRVISNNGHYSQENYLDLYINDDNLLEKCQQKVNYEVVNFI